MTRPKRTPPSSTPKRASFEIPASLQHLSVISRSLATTMAAASPAGPGPRHHSFTNSNLNTAKAFALPRPTLQSAPSASPISSTRHGSQHATTRSVPQKRSFSEFQPSSQTSQAPSSSESLVKDAGQSSMLAEARAKARAAAAASKLKSPQAPQANVTASSLSSASVLNPGGRSTSTNNPNVVAQVAARQRGGNSKAQVAQNGPPPVPYIPEEPPLKVGEAPSLATHPNLIAQMIAKKRAEAEAQGHRKRWAQRQQEYRMLSLSPGAQLTHELDAEVIQTDVKRTQPRTSSDPLPARSAPTILPVKPPTPIVFIAELPPTHNPPPPRSNSRTSTQHTLTAETVPTPTAGKPARPTAANTERQSANGNGLLFGSRISPPTLDLLEKAMDGTGFTGPSEPNQVVSNRTSFSVSGATKPQPSQTGTMVTPASVEGNSRSQGQSHIPALFSEAPPSNKIQLHKSSSAPKQTEGNQHFEPNSSMPVPVHGPQTRPQQGEGQVKLAPRQPPTPQPVPYYPQQTAMPSYYRVETHQDWSVGGSSYVTPASTAATSNAYQPVVPGQGSMAYSGYALSAVHPYAIAQTGLPPPPGPLQTYGNTAVVAGSTDEQKQPGGSGDYLTAADLVAGINLKFKHATKGSFRVPKR